MKRPKRIQSLIERGRKEPRPAVVPPMLCTRIREPFNDRDWIYEVKWDGYRIIARIWKGKVQLFSRGAQNYTKNYPPVVAALSSINSDLVLDGELVVLNEDGTPNFDKLQKYNG